MKKASSAFSVEWIGNSELSGDKVEHGLLSNRRTWPALKTKLEVNPKKRTSRPVSVQLAQRHLSRTRLYTFGTGTGLATLACAYRLGF